MIDGTHVEVLSKRMASMIEGKISDEPVAKISRTGEFKRPDSLFRGQVLESQAERDRYHLYVSYACPWAHRTLIVRNLKKLQSIISLSVTDPFMGERGWTFKGPQDPRYLAVLYLASDKKYSGKITVPVLWDTEERVIVNNESSDIIRILNSSFNHLTDCDIDLYPDVLNDKINHLNSKIYEHVNNGVYKTGFAANQNAYEKNCLELFKTLDELDSLLGEKPFLTGEYFTEADVRLFTTLIRFDVVYYYHFKCNLKRIADYPNLYPYLKSLYQHPDIRSTCHFDHIKEHYYQSHPWINPTRIVPLGPPLDLDSPHRRGEVKFYPKRLSSPH